VNPILWFALAAAVLALELAGADGDGLLLIAGLAGLLLTLLSALLPALPTAAQLVLFLALVAAGYAGLRRWSAGRQARAIPPSARAELAEVISRFDSNGEGRVRWQGQSWAAESLDEPRRLEPGDQVVVMRRVGTCLEVMASES